MEWRGDGVTAMGATERGFVVEREGDRIPGILWSPAEAAGAASLVLVRHGGSSEKRNAAELAYARRMVRREGITATPTPSPAPTAASRAPEVPLAFIILLSDGAQTLGSVQPLDAADDAKSRDVPVFTIALGTHDGVAQVEDNQSRQRNLRVPPDVETLKEMADITGGKYYSAPTADDLDSIYNVPRLPENKTNMGLGSSRAGGG